jgi:hypothetical protein
VIGHRLEVLARVADRAPGRRVALATEEVEVAVGVADLGLREIGEHLGRVREPLHLGDASEEGDPSGRDRLFGEDLQEVFESERALEIGHGPPWERGTRQKTRNRAYPARARTRIKRPPSPRRRRR